MKNIRLPNQQRSFGFRGIMLIVVLFGTLFLTRASFMQGVTPQKPGTHFIGSTSRAERFRKGAADTNGSPAAVIKASSVGEYRDRFRQQ